jgi:hypothetical protein
VFQGTAFWVMLTADEAYAQTGWAKEGNDSVEYVFLQYTDENGDNLVTKYYNASTGQWQGSKATQPPSSKEYNTTWVEGTGETTNFNLGMTVELATTLP